MKVDLHIGIPTLDGKMEQPCLMGLLSAWGRWPCSLSLPVSCYIGRNRDIIVADFLDGDASHVLFVDADIAWTSDDVAKLLELRADFAFGRYPYKGKRRGWVSRGVTKVEWDALGIAGPSPFNVPEALEAERCGGGFVLCSRACIERMVESYAFLQYANPADGRTLHGLWWSSGYAGVDDITHAAARDVMASRSVEGEDYAFCRRWLACGDHRIVTRSDVRLGHVGSHTYRMGC